VGLENTSNIGNTIQENFGHMVFNAKTMKKYLSPETQKSLLATMLNKTDLDPSIADEVADAMKRWAIEKGATHFTHWFQPLNGTTAEKHDAFFNPDIEGNWIASFSGKELSQSEPDASSFPSGGLRATFEARGYTVWDPTSPAFIRESEGGVFVLCIPSLFFAYHGDALDKKTPLLRSQSILISQIYRVAKIFNIPIQQRPIITLGAEQEYFLVDINLYKMRMDLMQTGRTLFGVRPARHQQMEDHYFGKIHPRVLLFMAEVERELWNLGVPAKTRHNEVSPGQFEFAPVFEEQNLAVDHNMLCIGVLQSLAEKHGFVCITHEKPFSGVNGSGKHNNWSIVGPDAKNWLTPGETPHENAKFLFILTAIIKAVDTYASLIRATVASAGNDHRLGENEAPPAIMSIFLGEQLSDIIDQLECGVPTSSKCGNILELGISSLPKLPQDVTDRNRTSPFAFTGNKFEFRSVGSDQSCASPNTAINLAVAEALDLMLDELEQNLNDGIDFNLALQALLQKEIKAHKRVLFDGNGYSEEWKQEALKRGLPCASNTLEAIQAFIDPSVVALFEKYKVLSEKELQSRYAIAKETYKNTILIEARCALVIVKTMILPAGISYAADLANALKSLSDVKNTGLTKMVNFTASLVDSLAESIEHLEETVKSNNPLMIIEQMKELRHYADQLEKVVPDNQWPLPSYADMFFI